MRARLGRMAALMIGMAALTAVTNAIGQPAAGLPKAVNTHGHNIRVRKGGTQDWKTAPWVGVEFFTDSATNGIIALTQGGGLAVALGGPVGADKRTQWLFAHDVRARKADEAKFTESTTKYGVEVLRDLSTGKLLYLSEKEGIALADAPPALATDKGPLWHHALVLKVRAADEKQFTATTKMFGIEVFKDENTGGLLYVSETGSLATAPAPSQPPAQDMVKAPRPLHGLNPQVRKADEADFTPTTRRVGIEVFQDANTGGLVYISDMGAIATAPAPAHLATGQGITWKHSFTLKARPGGEKDFGKANKFGIEVFLDNNTGHYLYLCETGSIAVLPKK